MLLVAMLALGTATFAWFTTSTNPYADNFSAKTTSKVHFFFLIVAEPVGHHILIIM